MGNHTRVWYSLATHLGFTVHIYIYIYIYIGPRCIALHLNWIGGLNSMRYIRYGIRMEGKARQGMGGEQAWSMDEWRRNFEHGIVWCGVAYYGMQTVISSMEGEKRRREAEAWTTLNLKKTMTATLCWTFETCIRIAYSFIYLSIYLLYSFTYASLLAELRFTCNMMCYTM